jgi:hypothetical protein
VEDAAAADRVIVLVGGQVAYAGPLEGVADVAGESRDEYADLDPVSRGLLRLWGTAEEVPR